MPVPALVSTPGAANANTYADLAYYKTFIATRRPKLSWATLAAGSTIDDDLTVDLLAAAKLLDSGFVWTGQPANATQALIAPRIGWLNRNGVLIDLSIVPDGMKDAQCELAATLHDGDVITDDEAAKANVRSVKADTVAVEFQSVSDSLEAVNAAMRRRESQFTYLSMPAKVRMYLVPSWYVQAEMSRDAIFEVL